MEILAVAAGAEKLFAVASLATAVGTGISSLGQYQSNRAQQEAANRNAAIAVRDAQIKKRQYERDAQREMAMNRAQMASNGLLFDQSSSLDVLADIASQHAEKALLIQYEGDVEAARSKQRAAAYGSAAKGALIGGAMSVGTGLLGSAYTGTKEFGWGRGGSESWWSKQMNTAKGMKL